MPRPCEVCRSFRPDSAAQTRASLFEVEFGKRAVTLCATHAYIWRWSKVSTFEGLRKLFRESKGKRSFISRRVRADQPPQRDRRANAAGRRSTDRD